MKLFWWFALVGIGVVAMADDEYDDYYYDDDYDRDSGYGGGDDGGINPLAALIAPLAGLALLGAAAAVSINPVLVQLAVINGGRRKKRDLQHQKKVTEIQLLENFLAKETDFPHQTENMVAQYMQCSGLSTDQNQCLERLVCIYAANGSNKEASKQEREVISIILYQMMSNRFVSDQVKLRMKYAGQLSKFLGGQCKKYYCPTLDSKQ